MLLNELAIELTVCCNLKCKMCSVWMLREHGVSHDLAKKLLCRGRKLGARVFTPCGAECFTRKDFLELIMYAHELGYSIQDIVTNGTMITHAHLDQLEKVPSVRLHISIDGPRDVHDKLRGAGCYDKAVAVAEQCVMRGIRVELSGVILNETIGHLRHLIDLSSELGISVVSYQPFQEEIAEVGYKVLQEKIARPQSEIGRFKLLGKPKEVIIDALEDLSDYACGRGIRIFTESMFSVIPDYLAFGKRPIPPGGCKIPGRFLLVNYKGDVYPCFFMRTEKDRMGNVYHDDITNIWNSSHHQHLQDMALTKRCPGCLAACSDVEAFNDEIESVVTFALSKE